MGLREILVPTDTGFFNLIEELTDVVMMGVETFHQLVQEYQRLENYCSKIKSFEHRADNLVHEIHDRLNKSFITPFDHADISSLVSQLDDILDIVDGAALRMKNYKVPHSTEAMVKLSATLKDAVLEVKEAVLCLRKLSNSPQMLDHFMEIHRLENLADELSRQAVANLFNGSGSKDFLSFIKYKEIYELIETAVDKAEDVANILSAILLKNT